VVPACKQLEPQLLKLGQEWAGAMAKIDVDENVNLTMKFRSWVCRP
jgi:thioredoxin-like negative regulator of GroEL